MPSRWNSDQTATAAVVASVTSTRKALQNLFWNGIWIAGSLLALNYRSSLLVILSPSWLRNIVQVVFWVTPMVFSGRALDTVAKWRSSRLVSKAQDKVTGSKRKLYGLPPPPPRQEPLRQRRPFSLRAGEASGAPQSMPITPPQRYSTTRSAGLASTPFSTTSGTPAMGGSLLATTPEYLRTPTSDTFRRSPQPPAFSPGGAVVASPEQLSYYFDNLSGATSSGVMASPQHAEMLAGQYTQAPAAYAAAADQDQGPTETLPVGVNAPFYRMTWMPKKAAAAAAADTPTLTPSSPEEVEDFVVSILTARPEWLEPWTERLREWLAGRVLKPLVAAVISAHEPVNTLLQQFGQSPRLPPLPDMLSDVRSAGIGDVDGVLRSLQTSLSQHVAAQPAAAATPKAKELLAAVNRYADLLAVLRGKRPADILPPSNSAYVWSRVQQLAESSCLKEFTWNGGAAYAGRPWSAEQLPTDSALVLYLFVAYLDAPGWQFTAPPNTQAEGGTQALYLGTMPTGARSTSACSAILTYRPERHGKDMDALLALQLQSTNPLFCYLAAGRLMVLANWYQHAGVFHVILFFVQYHKVRCGGAIGRQHIEDPDLALDAVVQPPSVGAMVSLSGRLFRGLGWFL